MTGASSLRSRPAAAVLLGVCLVLAGCGGVLGPLPGSGSEGTAPPPGDGTDQRPDPAEDVIGWEDGYWHNESIDVDQSDGLSDAELRRYVARGMARVEYVREREFRSRVPVGVISREEYGGGGGGGGSDAARAWNEQVWEGLWMIGENTTVGEASGAVRGSSVAGFYSPSQDRITIITPTPEEPTIDAGTLIHELTHALQDQYGDLSNPALAARTQDADLATTALVEGEANYVEDRYAARCGDAWDCVGTPSQGGGGGGLPEDFNFGYFATVFFPYSDGPVWVADLVERRGWAALGEAYDDPPASSEQVIHLTEESPAPVSLSDRSTDEWRRYPDQGVDGADRVGEASIFAMFWYQSRTYEADVVDVQAFGDVDSPYDTYDYASEASAGWGNDRLVPYRTEDGRDGYVWRTVWDTETDAEEFLAAYRAVLDAHDAERRGNGTYVVPDGPFADAFRLEHDGTRVTVVNGPTVEALGAIRPASAADDPPTGEPTTTSSASGPGPGVLGAVLAALLVAVLAGRRRG